MEQQANNVGTGRRLLDRQLIDRYSRNEAQWVQELNALATRENSAEWAQGSVADWATESLKAAKLLYRKPGSQDILRPGTKLGEEYYTIALPVVRERLARSGVRLAGMLNQMLK